MTMRPFGNDDAVFSAMDTIASGEIAERQIMRTTR
jgi:hypothetical protein